MDDIKFEQLPKRIEEFEKKWTKNNPDRLPGYCHNIYHLISEDMDGNVTNEMYAVNCMTDFGFRSAYVDRYTWSNDSRIYVGSGTSIPQTNSRSMETPISTTGSVNTNNSFTLSQQKFHSDTGILTCRFHLLSGYFDYTVFPEDKEVTEIGVGVSTTALYYHARVYDAQGNPSSFIKKLNERLTIHVYITGCMKIADIINRAWNKGLYLQFTPYRWFCRGVGDWGNDLVVDYDAYHNKNNAQSDKWQPFSDDTRAIDGNVVTASHESALGSRYIEGRYEYVCDVNVNGGPNRIGNSSYGDRYSRPVLARFLFKPKLETPEKITCFELYTNSYKLSDISNIFGLPTDTHERRSNGNIPVVDFDISGDDAGLWMYSCQDHDWTISENFVNAKDTAYDCEYIVYSDLIQYYYVEHLNDYANFCVFLNTRPDIPITAFTLSGAATFYATDAWWDTGSWEIIPNVSSIPERLQTKRYYCTLTIEFPYGNSFPGYMFGTGGWYNSFKTTRTQPVHSITTKEGSGWHNYGWTQTPWRDDYSTTNSKVITNDEYGYVACADWLIYPDTIDPNADTYVDASTSDEGYWYRYRLCGTGDAFSNPCLIWNTTKGDKIVVGGNTTWKNGFRVYDVNNDPTVEPTYQDYLFETSWGNNNPHWSFSNNGFVATSYLSGTVNVNRIYILDWYGGNDDNTPVMSYIDGYHHGHIIDLTNYICAINANVVDHLSLDVIDMKTKEVYSTIDIPEGYTFQGMCGWKNWIYIRVEIAGAYSTYLYYIGQQILTSLPINYSMMTIDGSSYYSHIQRAVEASGNCESCMVMIASNRDIENQYHLLFKSSDPENPIRILANYSPSTEISRYNRNANVMNQAAQLRYVNDNKQLLLAIKNRRGFVIDIGRILDEGTQTLTLDIHYWYNEKANEGPAIGLYKNRAVYVMDNEYAWNIDGHTGNKWCRFYIDHYPIENFLPHKVIGYTRTINSYHNPKQIGGVTGIKIQLSNDVSIWDPQ